MRGLMTDTPLLISSLIRHADRVHGDRVIVTSWEPERALVLVEPIDRVTALRVEGGAPSRAESGEPEAKSGDAAVKRVIR